MNTQKSLSNPLKMKAFKIIFAVFALQSSAYATSSDNNNAQTWLQQPRYQEVNPGGDAKMECLINDIRGECRWEKDGIPLTVYPGKYEWAGSPEGGDCSLRVIDAQLEYDDGVWQCQVTPSSFKAKDALISEGAQLVVRGEDPDSILSYLLC